MNRIFPVLLLLAAPAFGQFRDNVKSIDVSQLPATCIAARIYNVRDGASGTDCSTGGGSTAVWCICDAGGASYTGVDPAAVGGGAPTNADYLVGTANGSLSAEIVAGTSPQGELGGTWGSPTVDATHSGSAHHVATVDTGPSPDCSGTSTYQDGEGNCDAVGGDLSGGLDAAVVGDDSHAHTTTTLSGIAVSDLANGTDGELITWDAAGAPATVAVGTATHVLTSNGAGAAPTFQAAAGGSGAMPPIIFRPQQNEPPTSNYATLDFRNNHPMLDFDDTTDEYAIVTTLLPAEYAGGGLTCDVYWAATTATTGDVGWEISIEYMDDGTLDLDADSFAAANTAASTTSGTSGVLTKTTITFTDGADMDSWAAGNPGRIRVMRDADEPSDLTGDAELKMVVCNET